MSVSWFAFKSAAHPQPIGIPFLRQAVILSILHLSFNHVIVSKILLAKSICGHTFVWLRESACLLNSAIDQNCSMIAFWSCADAHTLPVLKYC